MRWCFQLNKSDRAEELLRSGHHLIAADLVYMAKLQLNMWVGAARSAVLSVTTGGGKWVMTRTDSRRASRSASGCFMLSGMFHLTS